jgi:uncharacterized protein (TIGR03067 family)
VIARGHWYKENAMRFMLGLAASLMLLAWVGGTTAADKDTLSPADLVGGYKIVSGEHEGKPEPKDRLKGDTALFTRDTITVTDASKKKAYVATYKLDSSKSPCRITMTSTFPREGVAQGLIKKEGNTVTLIYALPGGAAPTDFKTKEKQNLFVMKRLKK